MYEFQKGIRNEQVSQGVKAALVGAGIAAALLLLEAAIPLPSNRKKLLPNHDMNNSNHHLWPTLIS